MVFIVWVVVGVIASPATPASLTGAEWGINLLLYTLKNCGQSRNPGQKAQEKDNDQQAEPE
jgi:hypothetical protein